MNGVNRITIHHEGNKVVTFNDYQSTMGYMELIRRYHVGTRRYADIGYHFIIDRAGRVIEGRELNYQGAHVGSNNEHNIGVMCLGNFDLQYPTDAQLDSLAREVAFLRRRFKVSANRIYTHQELRPTRCPGRNMQPRIVAMRSQGAFA